MGKMMDQGPVLIITFQAQVVMVIRSPKGDIVEGDPVSEPITAALVQGILNFSWTSLLLFCSVWLCREKNPSVSDLIFLSVSTGEGDAHDVCVGAVSRPGGAESQRSLETPGHLCLQHRAGPLGG